MKNRLIYITFLINLIVIVYKNKVNAELNSDCVTPTGEDGKCILLTSCTVIQTALQTKDQATIELLRKSHCGFDKQRPLTCCGTSVYPNATTTLDSIQKLKSDCVTPNGERTNCVLLTSCTVIQTALQTKDQASVDFLRKSHCGFDKQRPLVCCGTSGTSQPATTTLETSSPKKNV